MMRMRAWIRPRLHRRSINLIRRVNKCEEAYGRKNDTAQLVKELAEAAGTSGKVAKLVLEKYAVIAVRETRRRSVCASGHRALGTSGAEGADGPQSCDG
jgi:hypothetical protein